MSSIFSILMLFAMAAVLGVLIIGILSMAKGGTFDQKYANKFMQARVYLQAAALLLFVLAMLAYKK